MNLSDLLNRSNMDCRIVEVGTAHTGPWNMACDEWLLESALRTGQATVRVYAWSRPTVSLGYFQQPDSLDDSPLREGLDRVQRLSGGGAIVHHFEWTYSCVVPPQDTRNSRGLPLYARIHQALVDQISACSGQEIPELGLRGHVAQHDQPALCFARAADEDVICKGHKVLGSAQRRRRGAILQHGSLLLHQSPHAPEFPGLLDLVAGLTLPEDFPETMARAISESLQWQAALEPLSESERTEIEGLAAGNLAGLRTRSGS